MIILGAAVCNVAATRAAEIAPAQNAIPEPTLACTGCHGAQGDGNPDIGIPRLAALSRTYILSQLAAFASGERESLVMTPIAKGLSASDAEVSATYFAGLPGFTDAMAPAQAGVGRALALRGRWSAGIPACVSCHGPAGVGVGPDFPPLAGQPVAYIRAQLLAWQHGKRPAGPLGLMQVVARRLTATDIEAVAAWFGAVTGGRGR